MKSGVAEIPAYKIFNIFKVKEANLKAIVEGKGAKLVLEPHTGIRELWGTWEGKTEIANYVDEEDSEEE